MNADYFIDTHAHIDGDEFLEDIDEVIKRAQDANVKKIFIPNINASTLKRINELCCKQKGCLYPMIGIHPEDVIPGCEDTLDKMEKELSETNSYIAIGEIGLDYYWDETHKALQKEIFKKQVAWGVKHNLPLMIHTRSAHSDMVEIIKTAIIENGQKLKGIFHCFAGTAEEAKELLEFDNFMLGIGGIVTFKKSALPDTLANTVPLERIVLETDAPYMAPVPNRGKRNESAYIKDIAAKLSEIYNCNIEHIMTTTTNNALKTFTKAQ